MYLLNWALFFFFLEWLRCLGWLSFFCTLLVLVLGNSYPTVDLIFSILLIFTLGMTFTFILWRIVVQCQVFFHTLLVMVHANSYPNVDLISSIFLLCSALCLVSFTLLSHELFILFFHLLLDSLLHTEFIHELMPQVYGESPYVQGKPEDRLK